MNSKEFGDEDPFGNDQSNGKSSHQKRTKMSDSQPNGSQTKQQRGAHPLQSGKSCPKSKANLTKSAIKNGLSQNISVRPKTRTGPTGNKTRIGKNVISKQKAPQEKNTTKTIVPPQQYSRANLSKSAIENDIPQSTSGKPKNRTGSTNKRESSRKDLVHRLKIQKSHNTTRSPEFSQPQHENDYDGDKPMNDQSKKYSLNYKRLKELAERDSTNILFTLHNSGENFTRILNFTKAPKEVMAYTLIVIGKACMSQCENIVRSFVNTVSDSRNFMLSALPQYLAVLISSEVQGHHKESLIKILEFFRCYQRTLPASASQTIGVIFPLLRDICRIIFNNDPDILSRIEDALADMYAESDQLLSQNVFVNIRSVSRYERLHSAYPPDRTVDRGLFLESTDPLGSFTPVMIPNIKEEQTCQRLVLGRI